MKMNKSVKIFLYCLAVIVLGLILYAINFGREMYRFFYLTNAAAMFQAQNNLELKEYELAGCPEDQKEGIRKLTHITNLRLRLFYAEANLCLQRAFVPDPRNNFFYQPREIVEEIQAYRFIRPRYYRAVSEEACRGKRPAGPPITLKPNPSIW